MGMQRQWKSGQSSEPLDADIYAKCFPVLDAEPIEVDPARPPPCYDLVHNHGRIATEIALNDWLMMGVLLLLITWSKSNIGHTRSHLDNARIENRLNWDNHRG